MLTKHARPVQLKMVCLLAISLFFGCTKKDEAQESPKPPLGALLPGPSRGSAAALSPDESVLVVCNRDAGSVTIFSIAYSAGQAPAVTSRATIDVGPGSEPWQAVVDPSGDAAYVVLRKSQRLVRINQLKSAPVKSPVEARLGSEPTGVALTPQGTLALIPNWVDGTLSVINTASMADAMPPIDLNAVLAPRLGLAASRPALAHPRAVAVTNHAGSLDDTQETVFVTEDFALRTTQLNANGGNADLGQRGIVYKVDLAARSATVVELAPLANMGFNVKEGTSIVPAACYPNQLQSITINGNFAYVLSICASPKGPIGPFFPQAANANILCPNGVSDCASLNLAEAACVVPQIGQASACVDLAPIKTATTPLLSVINVNTGEEVPEAQAGLNAKFKAHFDLRALADDNTRRFPLIANDLTFVPGSGIAYLSANGADAVFRIAFDPSTGVITEVGTQLSQPFINLVPAGIAVAKEGRGPVAVATGSRHFAFSANDITRNVSVLDLNTQSVAGGAANALAVASAALPVAGSLQDKILRGKRFFNTGGGRWSLKGQAWNSCQSCHIDGLTDNVTWFFARGPRQTTSLDGTFSKKNPNSDQRVLNWTAIFDEMADFELNTRGVSGGVGAIVTSGAAPLATGQRINLGAVPLTAGGTINHQGLNGSALAASDSASPGIVGGVLPDWIEITEYLKTVRAPRGATNLDVHEVAQGRSTFLTAGCQGCHSGDKWTISRLFYDPKAFVSGGAQITTALKTTNWESAAITAGFPTSLFPASAGNRTMRYAGANAANLDQIVCSIRPVGTFGVAEATGVAEGGLFPELRANMTAVGQGNEAEGKGFNPPALVGMMTGAPYLHHGGARTLEALFSPTFALHHQALSPNFQPSGQELAQLVQFLLSIDEQTATVTTPILGPQGGNLCAAP